MSEGYIKLPREIVRRSWRSPYQILVLIHCITEARSQDGESYGIYLKRGQLATGRRKIAHTLGIKEHHVRSSLNSLRLAHLLTISTHSQYSVISITNYDQYQGTSPARHTYDTVKAPLTKKERKKEEEVYSPEQPRLTLRDQIIDHLNSRLDSSYKAASKKTTSLLSARYAEGHTDLDDYRTVIDHKHIQWGGDDRMRPYLRPETLFGTKFEGYLQEARAAQRHDSQRRSEHDDATRRLHELFGPPEE